MTRHERWLSRRRRDDRGSMAVEIVLLVPALMAFIMLIVAGGRYVAVEGDIEGTARDAARAASQERSAAAANAAAQRIVDNSLDGLTECGPARLSGAWEAGGMVVVELNCRVSYAGLGLIGLPGSVSVKGESAAPLDRYKEFY